MLSIGHVGFLMTKEFMVELEFFVDSQVALLFLKSHSSTSLIVGQ